MAWPVKDMPCGQIIHTHNNRQIIPVSKLFTCEEQRVQTVCQNSIDDTS